MSTRAAVMLIDDMGCTSRFYRHSDGYPEGVAKSLDKFCDWLQKGYIRGNTDQGGGWLLMIGAAEYGVGIEFQKEHIGHSTFGKLETLKHPAEQREEPGMMDWKVGAYEPMGDENFPGDIEHLYVVDMELGKWREAPIEWAEKFNEERSDDRDPWTVKPGDIISVKDQKKSYCAYFLGLSDKFGFKLKVRPVTGGKARSISKSNTNAERDTILEQ